MINILDWDHRRPCKRTFRNITSVQCNSLSQKRVGDKFFGDKFQTYKVLLIENSGLRFWNPNFGFCYKTRNPNRILRPTIHLKGDFQLRNSNPNFEDFLLLPCEKGFAKLFSLTVVFSLLIANEATELEARLPLRQNYIAAQCRQKLLNSKFSKKLAKMCIFDHIWV